MDIDGVMSELGRRMKLGALKLDDQGLCRIMFDEQMVVDFEVDRSTGTTSLYGVVIAQAAFESVAGGSGSILEELLAANLGGVNGHDNYLCLDREAREIVLFGRLPGGNLDYEAFVDRLENFVNDLEHWLDRFGAADVGTDAATPAPETVVLEQPVFGQMGGFRI